MTHDCDTWVAVYEVREVKRPGDPGYQPGGFGSEHDAPYRRETCAHGETRIVPFTPAELEISDVLTNEHTSTQRSVS